MTGENSIDERNRRAGRRDVRKAARPSAAAGLKRDPAIRAIDVGTVTMSSGAGPKEGRSSVPGSSSPASESEEINRDRSGSAQPALALAHLSYTITFASPHSLTHLPPSDL